MSIPNKLSDRASGIFTRLGGLVVATIGVQIAIVWPSNSPALIAVPFILGARAGDTQQSRSVQIVDVNACLKIFNAGKYAC